MAIEELDDTVTTDLQQSRDLSGKSQGRDVDPIVTVKRAATIKKLTKALGVSAIPLGPNRFDANVVTQTASAVTPGGLATTAPPPAATGGLATSAKDSASTAAAAKVQQEKAVALKAKQAVARLRLRKKRK